MKNVCALKNFLEGIEYQESSPLSTTGKLIPKDGKTYHIVINSDNPDIRSITTEKRLTEQACAELEKQIGYNLKIWTRDEYIQYPKADSMIDVTIDFKDNDPYFTFNTLAYAGYPSGSFKGKVVFNNKFAWLDGYMRTGAQLRELGIILPNMADNQVYQTVNYRQTVKHELCGHVFGLPHTDDDNDVMNAYYREDRIMFGKESKDTLNEKYGKASFIKRAKPDSYIQAVMRRRL